eukprot:gnl/MRDRNA2_/MRDRNA2_18539_c0_seq1.p1 gnl/MRDRNA2_/MRDRNA2_18539_c0~~gnl/MRDRNA2_/MRDRNA2_18539_c0_seq1.p1  ORF type:complete len:510 (+),score=62.47 gnl/MRDRNA2_/MRDRNA2_18539_c0_seq1:76-1605(+)
MIESDSNDMKYFDRLQFLSHLHSCSSLLYGILGKERSMKTNLSESILHVIDKLAVMEHELETRSSVSDSFDIAALKDKFFSCDSDPPVTLSPNAKVSSSHSQFHSYSTKTSKSRWNYQKNLDGGIVRISDHDTSSLDAYSTPVKRKSFKAKSAMAKAVQHQTSGKQFFPNSFGSSDERLDDASHESITEGCTTPVIRALPCDATVPSMQTVQREIKNRTISSEPLFGDSDSDSDNAIHGDASLNTNVIVMENCFSSGMEMESNHSTRVLNSPLPSPPFSLTKQQQQNVNNDTQHGNSQFHGNFFPMDPLTANRKDINHTERVRATALEVDKARSPFTINIQHGATAPEYVSSISFPIMPDATYADVLLQILENTNSHRCDWQLFHVHEGVRTDFGSFPDFSRTRLSNEEKRDILRLTAPIATHQSHILLVGGPRLMMQTSTDSAKADRLRLAEQFEALYKMILEELTGCGSQAQEARYADLLENARQSIWKIFQIRNWAHHGVMNVDDR